MREYVRNQVMAVTHQKNKMKHIEEQDDLITKLVMEIANELSKDNKTSWKGCRVSIKYIRRHLFPPSQDPRVSMMLDKMGVQPDIDRFIDLLFKFDINLVDKFDIDQLGSKPTRLVFRRNSSTNFPRDKVIMKQIMAKVVY